MNYTDWISTTGSRSLDLKAIHAKKFTRVVKTNVI